MKLQSGRIHLLKQGGWLVIALSALMNLTGCATSNGFSRFYRDLADPLVTNCLPYSGNTKILTTSDHLKDMKDLCRHGYGLIGAAEFQGPAQSANALMLQAKKVGADVVLVSSTYFGSEQAAVPWIQYQPGQTLTTTTSGTVNANVWGSGGSAYGTGRYYGTSTITTPGTSTTQFVPVTVDRYEYIAGFFKRTRPPILGLITQPLSPELCQRLERNTGVLVDVVVVGTPAFNANILEGDVLLSVNGEIVISGDDLQDKVAKHAGQKVDVEIWRNGQPKTIAVQFNRTP